MMSLTHACNSKTVFPKERVRLLQEFSVHVLPELVRNNHSASAMTFLALASAPTLTKPVPILVKDTLLPCLQDMIKHDTGNWPVIRRFVLENTVKENDDTLRTGLTPDHWTLPVPGRSGGPRATKLSAVPANLLDERVAPNGNRGHKRQMHAENQNGQRVGPKRHKVGNEGAGEELKHADSESELESEQDSDYDDDDGFVVSDNELSFESGVDSDDIPNTYQFED